MTGTFSDYCRFFLENYAEVRIAEHRVWQEAERMFMRLETQLRAGPWQTRRVCVWEHPRYQFVQIFKRDWPEPQQGCVHFEAGIDEGSLESHQLHLGLDVERCSEWAARTAFLGRLDALLQRYEAAIRATCPGSAHRTNTDWRSLTWSLDRLPEVTSEQLVQAVQRTLPIGDLVDEALYTADKTPIWRIDFLGNPREPTFNLKWYQPPAQQAEQGDPGGQRIMSGGGRLDTGCLQIDGTRGNYGPTIDGQPRRNICRLSLPADAFGLSSGTRVYFSSFVKTAVGASLGFYGDPPHELVQRGFPAVFSGTAFPGSEVRLPLEVRPCSDWQHVTSEMEIAQIDDYDVAAEGFITYLVTETQDTDLRVDCIEFGRC